MMHWFGSLTALVVGLVVVVAAEVSWQRAVRSAAAKGLVQRAGGTVTVAASPQH